MLHLEGVAYAYRSLDQTTPVLDNCDFCFHAGSHTAIMAPSGSGKTTLLHVLGLLEDQYTGRYSIEGQDVARLSDGQRSAIRASKLGLVFQDARLIHDLTVLDNIKLALKIAGVQNVKSAEILKLLDRLNLGHRADHFPQQLSGGEAQRVAVARAMVKRPVCVLADEPTGSLDQENRDMVLQFLAEYNQQGGTVVMVTHDPVCAAQAHQILTLQNRTLCLLDVLSAPVGSS